MLTARTVTLSVGELGVLVEVCLSTNALTLFYFHTIGLPV